MLLSGRRHVGAVSFTSRTGAFGALMAGRGTGAADTACWSLSPYHAMRGISLAGMVYRRTLYDEWRYAMGFFAEYHNADEIMCSCGNAEPVEETEIVGKFVYYFCKCPVCGVESDRSLIQGEAIELWKDKMLCEDLP